MLDIAHLAEIGTLARIPSLICLRFATYHSPAICLVTSLAGFARHHHTQLRFDSPSHPSGPSIS